MITINQLIDKGRVKKIKKTPSRALNKNPQKKCKCNAFIVMSPKKPNSAVRKVIKTTLNKKTVLAYVPGENVIIPKNSRVLIKGGNVPDLPGVKYKVILGVLDVKRARRATKRSKYGVKRITIK
ncbi:putative ribosomal protein S12 (apicoplast) [Babesia bovis T2Bo]|uniref:Rps12 n=1 Tax=Babesia bovis TaxID=5865 RepID=A7AXG1_BABBO|nr:putative ribosomal protein S12 [Babesia bovis T2Bo]EDO05084.1 putative ribosomal protein S12 [Babesia bovis T2Bo]|eukprot:YP_002290864.1 rps12 (apicoplast) [Babesia bovis T2Bo]